MSVVRALFLMVRGAMGVRSQASPKSRGAAMVEMAIVIIPLLFLVFAILLIGRLSYSKVQIRSGLSITLKAIENDPAISTCNLWGNDPVCRQDLLNARAAHLANVESKFHTLGFRLYKMRQIDPGLNDGPPTFTSDNAQVGLLLPGTSVQVIDPDTNQIVETVTHSLICPSGSVACPPGVPHRSTETLPELLARYPIELVTRIKVQTASWSFGTNVRVSGYPRSAGGGGGNGGSTDSTNGTEGTDGTEAGGAGNDATNAGADGDADDGTGGTGTADLGDGSEATGAGDSDLDGGGDDDGGGGNNGSGDDGPDDKPVFPTPSPSPSPTGTGTSEEETETDTGESSSDDSNDDALDDAESDTGTDMETGDDSGDGETGTDDGNDDGSDDWTPGDDSGGGCVDPCPLTEPGWPAIAGPAPCGAAPCCFACIGICNLMGAEPTECEMYEEGRPTPDCIAGTGRFYLNLAEQLCMRCNVVPICPTHAGPPPEEDGNRCTNPECRCNQWEQVWEPGCCQYDWEAYAENTIVFSPSDVRQYPACCHEPDVGVAASYAQQQWAEGPWWTGAYFTGKLCCSQWRTVNTGGVCCPEGLATNIRDVPHPEAGVNDSHRKGDECCELGKQPWGPSGAQTCCEDGKRLYGYVPNPDIGISPDPEMEPPFVAEEVCCNLVSPPPPPEYQGSGLINCGGVCCPGNRCDNFWEGMGWWWSAYDRGGCCPPDKEFCVATNGAGEVTSEQCCPNYESGPEGTCKAALNGFGTTCR